MKLRALRRRTIRRMGPVQAVAVRRLNRRMGEVMYRTFMAACDQQRVLVGGMREVLGEEIRRKVIQPMVRRIVGDFAGALKP